MTDYRDPGQESIAAMLDSIHEQQRKGYETLAVTAGLVGGIRMLGAMNGQRPPAPPAPQRPGQQPAPRAPGGGMSGTMWTLGILGVGLCFLGFPLLGLLLTSSVMIAALVIRGRR